jgi:hypothetical protein
MWCFEGIPVSRWILWILACFVAKDVFVVVAISFLSFSQLDLVHIHHQLGTMASPSGCQQYSSTCQWWLRSSYWTSEDTGKLLYCWPFHDGYRPSRNHDLSHETKTQPNLFESHYYFDCCGCGCCCHFCQYASRTRRKECCAPSWSKYLKLQGLRWIIYHLWCTSLK